jgi:hypothetical protein
MKIPVFLPVTREFGFQRRVRSRLSPPAAESANSRSQRDQDQPMLAAIGPYRKPAANNDRYDGGAAPVITPDQGTPGTVRTAIWCC